MLQNQNGKKLMSLNEKKVLILGAGGFIGSHLVKKLKKEKNHVKAVDLKYPEFSSSTADEFLIGDLKNQSFCDKVFNEKFDDVYQLAADMGGAGYIFTGSNDANIMTNSALININVLERYSNYNKIFYSSSACIYPAYNQKDPLNPNCSEDSAYPAEPDSEYGWEKLFSERLYLSYHKNHNLNIRIARFHNIFGPEGSWNNGKEKAPAALCRKILQADSSIDVWGDGNQTRSFLYIDDCLDAVDKFMNSDFIGPVNIGSEEMISITNLANMIMDIANKKLEINYVANAPTGVRGRNSDNKLFLEKVGWKINYNLKKGIEETYNWIKSKI
jgi:GDP-D-mannose 3',5'-epimerase